jgi:hypothetical protein
MLVTIEPAADQLAGAIADAPQMAVRHSANGLQHGARQAGGNPVAAALSRRDDQPMKPDAWSSS